MIRQFAAAAVLLSTGLSFAAEPKLSVKVEDKLPPKEISDAVRAQLDSKAMNVFDGDKLVCTVWAAKGLETKATADEAKAGLKYANIEPSTVVAAVKIPGDWRDYRKQKIKPGVYTLRLGIQPTDGDHQGTAPFNDFCLLCPADQDKSPETLDEKELFKLSAKTIGRKHPSMMLLFPNKKPADAPVTEDKPKEHYVLSFGVPVTAGGEKAILGFSLVIIGETASE